MPTRRGDIASRVAEAPGYAAVNFSHALLKKSKRMPKVQWFSRFFRHGLFDCTNIPRRI
jgi:hypothetical protein